MNGPRSSTVDGEVVDNKAVLPCEYYRASVEESLPSLAGDVQLMDDVRLQQLVDLDKKTKSLESLQVCIYIYVCVCKLNPEQSRILSF